MELFNIMHLFLAIKELRGSIKTIEPRNSFIAKNRYIILNSSINFVLHLSIFLSVISLLTSARNILLRYEIRRKNQPHLFGARNPYHYSIAQKNF